MQHLTQFLIKIMGWISPLLIAVGGIIQQSMSQSKPLWPGCRYTDRDRDIAIERGLKFIDHIASNPKYFADWGFDLLYCFYTISTTAKNEHLRQMARETGQKYARLWLQENRQVPKGDPDELADFIVGLGSSEKLLGVHDESLQQVVVEAASHYSPKDFLLFDPTLGPPPADIPETCTECENDDQPGGQNCSQCEHSPSFQDPYEVWQHALIATHTGAFYGVELGASYSSVLHWRSAMLPYPSLANGMQEDRFNTIVYAITHVIYTFNDYGKYQIPPSLLREEFDYLKSNLAEARKREETELLGEFIDSLKAFDTREADAEIHEGIEYLLSHQNDDGSWGVRDENDEDDPYQRYHSTWTAIDGLREYSYIGQRSKFPDPAPLIPKARLAVSGKHQ